MCSVDAQHKVFVDFVEYLERYANKVIYPLPLLEDFVSNDYKTIEERNFDRQILQNNRHHNELIDQNERYHRSQITKMKAGKRSKSK